MAEVTSAASFVTAALETAGYITQAQFLDAFDKFFSSGGALLYIIAALGAMISMVVFGSYKLFRYLFIMPFIYWLLIGPRAELSGAIWRMGATGYPRSLTKTFEKQNVEAAAAATRAVTYEDDADNLAKVKDGTATVSNSDTIKVSWVFRSVTEVVDNLVAQFVGLTVSYKDDKTLIALNKAKVLEGVLNAGVDMPEVSKMLTNDLLTECSAYTGASVGDGKQFSEKRTARLKKTIQEAGGDAESEWVEYLEQGKSLNQEVINNLKKGSFVHPSDYTASYVKANLDVVNNETAGTLRSYLVDYADYEGVKDLISYAEGENWKNGAIPCGAMWEILKHAIIKEAAWFKEKILKENVPEGKVNENNREALQTELCWAILEKLDNENYKGDVGAQSGLYDCDLVRVALIYMFRNAIAGSERSHSLQLMKDRMGFRGDDESAVVASVGDPQNWEYVKDAPEKEQRKFQQDLIYWSGGMSVDYVALGEFENKATKKREHLPYATIGKIGGPLDMAYVEQQRYHTRTLRQSIYSYAMQLPYWQGLMLYLIAAIYPFMCLIVLVPNRAQAIINYFLTWLWVKSWDIGMAAVMVTDRVMWNIFPRTDVVDSIKTTEFTKLQFEDVLQEAMRVDPTYNLHSYYMMISMGIFAIPAITGLVILKGKKSVLSVFSDQVSAGAKDAQGIRSSAYLGDIGNMQLAGNQAMNMMAYNPMINGHYGKTFYDKARTLASAGIYGATAGKKFISMIDSAAKAKGASLKDGEGGRIPPDKIPKFTSNFAGTAAAAHLSYRDIREQEIALEIAQNKYFNPLYGRFSERGIAMESRSNAIGTGDSGFEINDSDISKDIIPASQSLFNARFKLINETVGDFYGTFLGPNFWSNNRATGSAFGQGIIGLGELAGGYGGLGEGVKEGLGGVIMGTNQWLFDNLMPMTDSQREAIQNHEQIALTFPYGYGAAAMENRGYDYSATGPLFPENQGIVDQGIFNFKIDHMPNVGQPLSAREYDLGPDEQQGRKKEEGMRDIAAIQANNGNIEGAKETVNQIRDPFIRNEALQDIKEAKERMNTKKQEQEE